MAWLSGSFLSPKAEPDDVDCVYVVPAPGIEALSGRDRRVFGLFSWNRLRAETGLRVDAFVLPWPLIPGVDRKPQDSVYHQDRGYWDDLWQRRRSGPKDSPSPPEDALPRRGYVEVVLDGAV
jgi:hypothetical protein